MIGRRWFICVTSGEVGTVLKTCWTESGAWRWVRRQVRPAPGEWYEVRTISRVAD